MVKSMTGYGKGETVINNTRYIVEIRSLNGKTADVNLKTSLIPREKEMEVRQYIASELNRGTIDLFITVERTALTDASLTINEDNFKSYINQIKSAVGHAGLDNFDISADNSVISSVLRLPDVFESKKEDFTGDSWNSLFQAIKDAVAALNSFRTAEGATLKKDVLAKVDLISSYIPYVEELEAERIATVRSHIDSKVKELDLQVDKNRYEQEIIFYLEKLDINEEKVRLRQHCRYFHETIENEEFPGKKLGFIAQEMGREINTMGSKANHAGIQKTVVKMKDELEKIKEQSLNIL